MQTVTQSKLVTWPDFLALFHEHLHPILNTNLAKPGTLGMVCFECLQMDSSEFGERSALIYGPDCTYKTLESVLGIRLGDLPSRFKYPVAHFVKEL